MATILVLASTIRLLAGPDDNADVAALKKLSLEQLLNVEVTSVSRYTQHVMDAPSAISVITNDEIARSTALTLAETLRLADNLNVAQKDPHDWAISARGFNANVGDKMLVLIDGRTVYTPLFAGVFWNAQDYILDDIERVEVISGPGSTLWGANAVNGVINVTTKNAKETQGTYLEATGGTPWQGSVSARYGGVLAPNVYYRVYGKFLGEADAILSSGARANDSWHQGQGGFRIDAFPAADTTYTFQGDIYSGDLNIQAGNEARIAGGNLLGRWTRRLANDSDLQFQAYVDRTHLSDPFGATPFAAAGFLKDNLDTYDIDFQHSMHLTDRHHLVWGLGYRFTNDREPQGAPNFVFVPLHETANLFTGFMQDEIALSNQVAVIVGSKLEHNDFTGWEVEPNVRLRWKFTPNQMAWAAVSRAVRTPARFDRDLAEPAPPHTLIEGNPDFRSETLIAYELGYRALVGSNVGFSVSTFYNQYDRLRGLSLTPTTVLPLVYHNALDGHTYGMEIGADYHPLPRWALHGSYNLLREHVRIKSGQTDFFNGLDETEDPEQQWSVRSSVDLPSNVTWDTQVRWVDSLIANGGGVPATVPSYYEMDLRLGWKMSPTTEWSIGGSNLLHNHHTEYGPPGPSNEEIRRYVYAKVEITF